MRRIIGIACAWIMLLSVAAPAIAESAVDEDNRQIYDALGEAYMQLRYSDAWRSERIWGEPQYGQVYEGMAFYSVVPKAREQTAAEFIVEYDKGGRFDGSIEKEALEYKLNDMLNDMNVVQKSGYGAPELLNFAQLYATKVIRTYRVYAEVDYEAWRLGDHTFAPEAIAIRPFFFRDAPDSILEERVYLYVYMVADGRDTAWLCADDVVIEEIAQMLTGNSDAAQAWLEQQAGTDMATAAPTPSPAPTAVPEQTFRVPSGAQATSAPSQETASEEAVPAATLYPATHEFQIGKVQVTNADSVNLREGPGTEYKVVSQARSGAWLVCVGQADSGWYEVIVQDGLHAFISPKLVEFTPDN